MGKYEIVIATFSVRSLFAATVKGCEQNDISLSIVLWMNKNKQQKNPAEKGIMATCNLYLTHTICLCAQHNPCRVSILNHFFYSFAIISFLIYIK